VRTSLTRTHTHTHTPLTCTYIACARTHTHTHTLTQKKITQKKTQDQAKAAQITKGWSSAACFEFMTFNKFTLSLVNTTSRTVRSDWEVFVLGRINIGVVFMFTKADDMRALFGNSPVRAHTTEMWAMPAEKFQLNATPVCPALGVHELPNVTLLKADSVPDGVNLDAVRIFCTDVMIGTWRLATPRDNLSYRMLDQKEKCTVHSCKGVRFSFGPPSSSSSLVQDPEFFTGVLGEDPIYLMDLPTLEAPVFDPASDFQEVAMPGQVMHHNRAPVSIPEVMLANNKADITEVKFEHIPLVDRLLSKAVKDMQDNPLMEHVRDLALRMSPTWFCALLAAYVKDQSGLIPKEVLHMTLKHIDFEQRTLEIVRPRRTASEISEEGNVVSYLLVFVEHAIDVLVTAHDNGGCSHVVSVVKEHGNSSASGKIGIVHAARFLDIIIHIFTACPHLTPVMFPPSNRLLRIISRLSAFSLQDHDMATHDCQLVSMLEALNDTVLFNFKETTMIPPGCPLPDGKTAYRAIPICTVSQSNLRKPVSGGCIPLGPQSHIEIVPVMNRSKMRGLVVKISWMGKKGRNSKRGITYITLQRLLMSDVPSDKINSMLARADVALKGKLRSYPFFAFYMPTDRESEVRMISWTYAEAEFISSHPGLSTHDAYFALRKSKALLIPKRVKIDNTPRSIVSFQILVMEMIKGNMLRDASVSTASAKRKSFADFHRQVEQNVLEDNPTMNSVRRFADLMYRSMFVENRVRRVKRKPLMGQSASSRKRKKQRVSQTVVVTAVTAAAAAAAAAAVAAAVAPIRWNDEDDEDDDMILMRNVVPKAKEEEEEVIPLRRSSLLGTSSFMEDDTVLESGTVAHAGGMISGFSIPPSFSLSDAELEAMLGTPKNGGGFVGPLGGSTRGGFDAPFDGGFGAPFGAPFGARFGGQIVGDLGGPIAGGLGGPIGGPIVGLLSMETQYGFN
jgi:hypothetical protein